jgi:glyoxylase-like metal-dependent hydrolase (beta-lactamase superfamily II)
VVGSVAGWPALADRCAERFGARVWIHEADASAAPYVTDVVEGLEAVEVQPGLVVLPIPGHTRGSVAFGLEDRFLFTGDSLHRDHRRQRLDVFSGATWHSWEELGTSMARLVDVPFAWVLPGHGKWRLGEPAQNRAELESIVADMATVPRSAWRRRPS